MQIIIPGSLKFSIPIMIIRKHFLSLSIANLEVNS